MVVKSETRGKKDKVYHRPVLKDFGDLKQITQGSSGPSRDGTGAKSQPSGGG